MCRDYLTARAYETKKATFSSSIRARVSAEAGYTSGPYEAVYFRTNQFCFKASLTPDELLRGDVYNILTVVDTVQFKYVISVSLFISFSYHLTG